MVKIIWREFVGPEMQEMKCRQETQWSGAEPEAGAAQRGAERERRRLARELHDGLGQDLAWATLEVRRFLREADLDELCQQRLAEVASTLERLTRRVRLYSHEIHPARVEILGLIEALRMLARDVQSHYGVRVHIQLDGAVDGIPASTREAIYYIAQEALSNAARHASSPEVSVNLDRCPFSLNLAVIDLGVGLDPKKARAGPGLGLIAMEERAQALGGSLVIDSRAGGGTRVRASFPSPNLQTPAPLNDSAQSQRGPDLQSTADLVPVRNPRQHSLHRVCHPRCR